jgi:hypothetical protein
MKKYVQPQDYAMPLSQHKTNIHSQNGEDGVLKYLIDTFPVIQNPGWCCEFGAWDGKHLSNTFRLIREFRWQAVLIEADPEKFKDLKKTEEEYPDRITAIQSFVHYMPDKGENLDAILARTSIPKDFDILSVDVDGPDYHIWKSLENYEPKIVIIEHSGLAEPIIQREGAIHKKERDGSTSFLPMKELGESKGYALLVDTGNLIFMNNKYL